MVWGSSEGGEEEEWSSEDVGEDVGCEKERDVKHHDEELEAVGVSVAAVFFAELGCFVKCVEKCVLGCVLEYWIDILAKETLSNQKWELNSIRSFS